MLKTGTTPTMQELAVLASRVMSTERQFTSVADNVANVNTQGYRKLDMEFKELVSRPHNAPAINGASYVEDRAIHVSADQGVLQATSNPLDAAISGPGFFAVDVNGTTQYTRRGQFLMNSEGTLVTPEGNPVLDNAGAQIQIPEGTTDIGIAIDGTISAKQAGQAQSQIAQLGVYEFSADDLKKLERAGNTAFVPMLGATPTPVELPSVKQGFLESSNVSAVQEMVNLQAVTKAYESSVKLMKGLEDLESKAIQVLGQQ